MTQTAPHEPQVDGSGRRLPLSVGSGPGNRGRPRPKTSLMKGYHMKRTALALALLLPATAVFASGSAAITSDVQTQITALLTDQGYEVRSIQMEDGQYEAYAMRDGARFEIYLDDSLTIVRVEEDN
jgi:hypothetical protein